MNIEKAEANEVAYNFWNRCFYSYELLFVTFMLRQNQEERDEKIDKAVRELRYFFKDSYTGRLIKQRRFGWAMV